VLSQALAVVVNQHLPDLFTQQFARAVAQQLFGFLIKVGKAAVTVKRGKGFGNAGQRGSQAHGKKKRFLLSLLFNGNILQYALQSDDAAPLVMHCFASGAHPFSVACGSANLHFFIKRFAAFGALLQQ